MEGAQGRQYVVRHASDSATNTDFSSLQIETVSIPTVGENEVLVCIHAVSLNFRDIMVTTNTYLWPLKNGIVPCSDGAGEVLSVGDKVTRFKPGDRVAAIFNQKHISGSLRPSTVRAALGGDLDGMLREHAVLNENGLVHIPSNLSYEQASTLPCAGVTAWNALMGGGRRLQAGDTVVTQGTGGVSLFAAQFGAAAGARVISTTSSTKKEKLLKGLGVQHVLNYRETPDWGAKAKELSIDGEGADFVIEIGGPETVQQSLQAAKIDGIVSIIGQRTAQDIHKKSAKQMMLADAFKHICTLRRIVVGSRDQFEEMIRSISVNGIQPVVDERIFGFDKAKEAFQYLAAQKHVGNVVIRIDSHDQGRL